MKRIPTGFVYTSTCRLLRTIPDLYIATYNPRLGEITLNPHRPDHANSSLSQNIQTARSSCVCPVQNS